MSASQADLFGTAPHPSDQPTPEIVALVRARLHATLALVKGAEAMPWPDQLAIIREDNAFRYGKDCTCPQPRAPRYGPSSTWRWTGSTPS